MLSFHLLYISKKHGAIATFYGISDYFVCYHTNFYDSLLHKGMNVHRKWGRELVRPNRGICSWYHQANFYETTVCIYSIQLTFHQSMLCQPCVHEECEMWLLGMVWLCLDELWWIKLQKINSLMRSCNDKRLQFEDDQLPKVVWLLEIKSWKLWALYNFSSLKAENIYVYGTH